MTILRRRMREDMQLRGLAPKTQQCYLAAVHQLAHHYRRAPNQLSDEELRQYRLYLLTEKKVAESPFRMHLYGIRFFYERTLQRPWPVFELVRPRNPQTLPVGLSPQEVRSLLALVEHPKAQMCLRIISACGLRRRGGTPLQVSDIDAQRMLVRVRQGKGGKDRCVPLAPRVLEWWRAYWQRQRPHPWLCPARHRAASLPRTPLQKTFNAVVRQRGIHKEASVHTLRHSYATHRRERGVSLRVIHDLLGHKSPRPTARYTHLTPPTLGIVHATMATLMAALSSAGARSCPRWRMSCGATGATTWTGLDKTCCPAIAGRWTISEPAGPRPWAGSCCRASTGVRNTTSTTLAVTAVAPRGIDWRPKPGWQSGVKSAYRAPTFLSS